MQEIINSNYMPFIILAVMIVCFILGDLLRNKKAEQILRYVIKENKCPKCKKSRSEHNVYAGIKKSGPSKLLTFDFHCRKCDMQHSGHVSEKDYENFDNFLNQEHIEKYGDAPENYDYR